MTRILEFLSWLFNFMPPSSNDWQEAEKKAIERRLEIRIEEFNTTNYYQETPPRQVQAKVVRKALLPPK